MSLSLTDAPTFEEWTAYATGAVSQANEQPFEVLARHAEGSISPLLAGTAVLEAETWHGDADSLLVAGRQLPGE